MGKYPLGAGERRWGDPKSKIDGWNITSTPVPDDVPAGDAGTGFLHVGIVISLPSGKLGTAGVSSTTGKWTQTNYLFRLPFKG